MKAKKDREDDYNRRLLSFLNHKWHMQLYGIHEIRKGKWKVYNQQEAYFLKRYKSLASFTHQHKLIRLLTNDHFPFVIPFHPYHDHTGPIQLKEDIMGVTYWLEGDSIHYDDIKDRLQAHWVIKQFHLYSHRYLEEFPTLQEFDLLKKWKRRWNEFYQTRNELLPYMPTTVLHTLLRWGEMAIELLEENRATFTSYPKSMIHGDIAHHNFLRSTNHALFVIDFDLMTKGPSIIDDIQFANRILPHIGWSTNQLFSIPTMAHYKDTEIFHIGLLYPTDLYREWIRFATSSTKTKSILWRNLSFLTFYQYHQRMNSIQQLMIPYK
ncbi:hypothetical protein Q73_10115 [Bacillus coahuilensis m2-6]|uniref:phosphotransferase n=1 Tax=Bacillus coahuilensis TaxID=408580 RepID=UPI0007505F6B|nr:phosphotransferase [Bacillus coahuilensis]KUP06944.1 hypothetical protein Q73_10115 [Bacillus coahuilensis m2-6]